MKVQVSPFPSHITVEMTLVTPADAKRYLATMHANRSKSKLDIGVQKENLLSGTFFGGISPVYVDDADRAWDGQHRFEAIAETGISAYLLFIRGVTPEEAEYIDTGRKRSYADVLRMGGVQDYKRQSVLVKYIALYEHYGVDGIRAPGRFPVAQEAKNAHLNTDAVIKSIHAGMGLYRATGCNDSVASYAVWRTGETAPDGTFTVHPFWESVRTGAGLVKDDPALTLRNYLMSGSRRSRYAKDRRVLELFAEANAWNKFVTGQRYAKVNPPYSKKPNGDLYFAAADVPDFLPKNAGTMSRIQLSRAYAAMRAGAPMPGTEREAS